MNATELRRLTDAQYEIHQKTQETVVKRLDTALTAVEDTFYGALEDLPAIVPADRDEALLRVESIKYLLGQLDFALRALPAAK